MYSLQKKNGFIPGISPEEEREQEELERERKGYFHCFTEIEDLSPQTQKYREKTVAIVEDAATGKIHYVDLEQLRFVPIEK